MDNSLKELEAKLESMVPRGLSDEGEESCSSLIDELVAGKVDDLEPVRAGLSWKASAAAAVVALGIGLGSGWQLGRDAAASDLVEAEDRPMELIAGFEIIEHPVEILSEGVTKVYVDDESGEVREVWNKVVREKETILPVGTNYVIDYAKVDRHEVDVVKSEF